MSLPSSINVNYSDKNINITCLRIDYRSFRILKRRYHISQIYNYIPSTVAQIVAIYYAKL